MANSKRPRTSEAGFSLIEGLVAAALLLIVTVGILPLFSRAMQNNVKGNDSTRQANGAIDEYERTISMPFNSGAMDVPSGATEAVETRVIAVKDLGSPPTGPESTISSFWELPGNLAAGDVPAMTRQRTLRQYAFDDFADNQIFETPLNGDVEPRLVHFKVIDLSLSNASSPLARPYQLRLIQAY